MFPIKNLPSTFFSLFESDIIVVMKVRVGFAVKVCGTFTVSIYKQQPLSLLKTQLFQWVLAGHNILVSQAQSTGNFEFK